MRVISTRGSGDDAAKVRDRKLLEVPSARALGSAVRVEGTSVSQTILNGVS